MILREKSVCFIFLLFTYHFSVSQAENTETEDKGHSEPKLQCQTSHSATLDYKFNLFCPKFIKFFQNDLDSTMEKSTSKILPKAAERLTNDDKPKAEVNTSICHFPDSDTKLLLTSVISNHNWNFTDAEQKCHHSSLKFSEYDNLPCDLNEETNRSRPLRITTNGIRAFFTEATQICVSESQFLLLIFKIQKGNECVLQVQEHEIDPMETEGKCGDTETSSSCGLYPCSSEKDIDLQLKQITRPIQFSNSNQKPFSDYSVQFSTVGGNNHDEMKKKTSIKDYFFELLLLGLVIILLAICFLTNCCGLNNDRNDAHYRENVYPYINDKSGKRLRRDSYRPETEPLAMPLSLNLNNGNIKCGKKPACVCSTDKGNNSGKKTWGYIGNEESYAPVRNDSSSTYIPTVIRG